ncbi:MAG TPA: hypothetical protein VJU83_08790 [Burkholderiales bacterium]|nr:hypothetical protein [Burkholderiales bacterium]
MRLAAIIAASLLVACASPSEPARPGASKPATVTQKINLSGYPPEFRTGFTEGCSVARGESKAARPKGESQFSAGWADGYDYCKRK